MPFLELSGKNIRNLQDYHIKPSPAVNIITGKNGAGKTNVLEAIYLNALGRSFRTSSARNIIHDKKTSCWVFAEHLHIPFESETQIINKIGIERRKDSQQKLSINGIHHKSLADLAVLTPILAIQPSEIQLIDGPSTLRRKYLDWFLFHVEHSFLECWRENQRLLKQRNQLLRSLSKKTTISDSDYLQIKTWGRPYIENGERISQYRKQACLLLTDTINEYLKYLPAFNDQVINNQENNNQTSNKNKHKETEVGSCVVNVDIEFKSGWAKNSSLEASINHSLHQDIKQGFTRTGPHRADLLIKANSAPAKEFLSRGQKKLLSMVMRLAQAVALQKNNRPLPILLLDDFFAEIDQENIKAFIALVERLDTQVFLTCLHTDGWVEELFSRDVKLFHVEQGQITEQKQ